MEKKLIKDLEYGDVFDYNDCRYERRDNFESIATCYNGIKKNTEHLDLNLLVDALETPDIKPGDVIMDKYGCRGVKQLEFGVVETPPHYSFEHNRFDVRVKYCHGQSCWSSVDSLIKTEKHYPLMSEILAELREFEKRADAMTKAYFDKAKDNLKDKNEIEEEPDR